VCDSVRMCIPDKYRAGGAYHNTAVGFEFGQVMLFRETADETSTMRFGLHVLRLSESKRPEDKPFDWVFGAAGSFGRRSAARDRRQTSASWVCGYRRTECSRRTMATTRRHTWWKFQSGC